MPILAPLLLQEAKASTGQDFARTYSRTYLGYFDEGDDEEYVRAHCGVTPYTPHPTAFNSYALKIDVEMEGEAGHPFIYEDNTGAVAEHPNNGVRCRGWTIAIDFGPWNPLVNPPTANPLDLPMRKEYDWTERPVPRFFDEDGTPILNTAFDCYDPPVTIPKLVRSIKVRRNESSVNDYASVLLSNKTNASAWNGYPAGTVRSLPIRTPQAEYDQQSGAIYYPMEYGFEVDPDGWKEKVLNQGYRQLDATTGKPVRILDSYGMELSQPALLDANGHALPTPVSASMVLVNEYTVYPPIDFSGFNIVL